MTVKNFDRLLDIGNARVRFFKGLWLSVVLAHDVLNR